MSRVDRSVGDETSFISRLKAIRYDYGLNIAHKRVGSGLGRTEQAKVVDTVQSEESRETGLVDGASNLGKGGGGRVGGTVGESGDNTDLALSESGRDQGGKKGGGEHTGRHDGLSGVDVRNGSGE